MTGADARFWAVVFGCFLPLLPWLLIALCDAIRDLPEAFGWAMVLSLID